MGGLVQVSLSLSVPWHRLGLNFQLLQNKFLGGCTRSWHGTELLACLSRVVVTQGAAGVGLSCPGHARGWGSLPAAFLWDRAC